MTSLSCWTGSLGAQSEREYHNTSRNCVKLGIGFTRLRRMLYFFGRGCLFLVYDSPTGLLHLDGAIKVGHWILLSFCFFFFCFAIPPRLECYPFISSAKAYSILLPFSAIIIVFYYFFQKHLLYSWTIIRDWNVKKKKP